MIHLVTSLYPNMRQDTCLIFRTSNSVSNTIIFSVLQRRKITGLGYVFFFFFWFMLFAFLDRASRLCVFCVVIYPSVFIYIVRWI